MFHHGNMSNTRVVFHQVIQTLRKELKIQSAADISSVRYIFSIETKIGEKTEK